MVARLTLRGLSSPRTEVDIASIEEAAIEAAGVESTRARRVVRFPAVLLGEGALP